MNACEACGRSPAAPIKLKRNVGLVIAHRSVTAQAMLCAECADAATKQFQRQTLAKGWTSPRSALVNPATMAGNAFRKRRHERIIRDQMTSVGADISVGDEMATVDATDLLIAFGGFDVSKMPTVVQLIGDFQGGGVLSSPEQISAARRLPSQAEQQEMGDIASSVLEGLEAAGGNATFEGFMHGILVTGLWDMLKMTTDDVTDVHGQLSGAMLDAASRLQKLGRKEDAILVLLAGQMLYANLTHWRQSKAK
jgi:hypothetical protein